MENIFYFLDIIKYHIENNFLLIYFTYFVFLFLFNMFSLPGNLILIAGSGYFFGIYLGYLISVISLVFGSFVFFIISKFFLKKIFPKIYNNYSLKITKYISNSSVEYLIIFRMIPGPPLMLQNILLSMLNIKYSTFIFSSLIGFSPIIFITVFLGFHLNNIENLKALSFTDILSKEFFIFIIIIIFLLIIRIIYKKNKKDPL